MVTTNVENVIITYFERDRERYKPKIMMKHEIHRIVPLVPESEFLKLY